MRYFIGFLVTIGLIILLIVLLFTGGGGSNPEKPKTTKALSEYASTDAVVRLTIDGPIVADQDHQAVQITVGQDDVTYSQVQGYQGTVVKQQSFVNNQNAYSNFLYALGHAGFTRGDNSKDRANEKGYCPRGNRYIFELIDGGNDIQRYWATNCKGTKTYTGDTSLTLTLFQAQVPGYNDLTQGLSINNSLF